MGCFLLTVAAMAFSFVYGCARVESEDVRTTGIHADIDVEGNRNGTTTVVVDLNVGSGIGATDLELAGSDRLTATANGSTQVLSKSSNR